MSHMDNIGRWQDFAKSKGWKTVYPAPHEWLVTKLTGKACSPSLFWPSWMVGIFSGVFWGSFWGAFMYFTVWHEESVHQIAVRSLGGGLIFGFGMAAVHMYQKRKHGLTTWEKFLEEARDSCKRA